VDVGINVDSITVPKVQDNKFSEQTESVPLEQTAASDYKPKELAVLFMQISAPEGNTVLMNTVKTALGVGSASFIIAPKTTWTLASGAGRVIASNPIVSGIAVILGLGIQQGITYNNRNIASGKCEDVMTGNDARNGCSVVRVMEYDASSLQQYCSVIESKP